MNANDKISYKGSYHTNSQVENITQGNKYPGIELHHLKESVRFDFPAPAKRQSLIVDETRREAMDVIK